MNEYLDTTKYTELGRTKSLLLVKDVDGRYFRVVTLRHGSFVWVLGNKAKIPEHFSTHEEWAKSELRRWSDE